MGQTTKERHDELMEKIQALRDRQIQMEVKIAKIVAHLQVE